jgi:hypothetical protein
VHSRFFASLFARLTQWFADAQNGIGQIVARVFKSKRVETQELCVGATCRNEDQLAVILAGTAAGAATAEAGSAGAPGGSSATGDADTTLTLYGNNPVVWQLDAPWHDNLGVLFTRAGQSETIYSTSTVDVSAAGTTTIDYWAAIPATDPTQWLHTTRTIVVSSPANDNPLSASTTPKASNDDEVPEPLPATGHNRTKFLRNRTLGVGIVVVVSRAAPNTARAARGAPPSWWPNVAVPFSRRSATSMKCARRIPTARRRARTAIN